MASTTVLQPRRILCPNFNDDEVKALRSLCELLRKHLKHPWQVVTHGEADLLLVNLDAGWAPPQVPTVPLVGCALRPRAHPVGTIHRPPRAAELLAVFSEFIPTTDAAGAARTQDVLDAGQVDDRYVLLGWPLDFERWPPSWRRVLAALSRSSASMDEIAQCTGLTPVDIGRCIAMLDRQGLVERQRLAAAPVVRAQGRWKGLSERVGHLLGFSR
ncbi:MarR family transcriptional regulator [Aerolutibacter ruishenii]|uniref:MarR family protein n=1 Tax=Aerolutibacter ruishenii TaxID=686800 RepID=A0A562LWS5_9GAMM|nr:helix-turn-helix domain-containing protein [Lysobacter ruishenii]TWI11978.1 MarR family protein [Lysobacter ruishenii]